MKYPILSAILLFSALPANAAADTIYQSEGAKDAAQKDGRSDSFSFEYDRKVYLGMPSETEALKRRLSVEAKNHCKHMANSSTGSPLPERGFVKACTRIISDDVLSGIARRSAEQRKSAGNRYR